MRTLAPSRHLQVLARICLLTSIATVQSVRVHAYSPSPFFVVSPPNFSRKHLVMGIVPPGKVSPLRAVALARFAKTISRSPRGTLSHHVYVFEDRETGQAFARHQQRRRSAPLAERDFVALRKLWPRTLAFYELKQGRERVVYPSRNPQSWWKRSLSWKR